MNDFFKKLTSQKPFVYGLVYLGLIPLYAIITRSQFEVK
jgi:hypothetical protein